VTIDVPSYDSSGVSANNTTLSADGAGSILSLQSVTTLTDVWGVGGNSYVHYITASNGGQIDLSNLQTITGPADDERLYISTATGGTINLSALTGVSGSASGNVDFALAGPGTLNLPAVTSLTHTRFYLSGGAQLHADGAAAASFNNSSTPANSTIMSADGAGSILSLQSVTTLTDVWAVGGNSYVHYITASNGGQIDLRNLQTITGPANDERLEVSASNGASINLATLSSVLTTESGRVNFTLATGARLDFGNVDLKTGSTMSISDNGTTVHAAGIKTSAGPGVTISLNSAGSRLEVTGSLILGSVPPPTLPTITLTAVPGAIITIGGDFSYTQTNTASVKLDRATVQFNGAGTQRSEVGGQDLGVNGACLLSSGNFGFGQLIVGQAGQAATLRLSDLIDNGHRSGRAEALYLWGSFDRGNPPTTPCGPTAPQVDGLRILGGSTLVLDYVNVYTFQGGQWIDLNCLLPSNNTAVPFDGGFIRRGGCYVNCDGSTAAPTLNIADFTCFLNRFAEANCYANCDSSTAPPVLNIADFTCFLQKFAAGCSGL
jgi:hypothetical protein